MVLVAVSRFECLPSEGFTQHSGAFIGRRRPEPSQNPSARVRVLGALANLSHLGTTVTIEELPLRRAKDITFAFLLPEAFSGKLFSFPRSGRPPVASPETPSRRCYVIGNDVKKVKTPQNRITAGSLRGCVGVS
jgi:hypothetical protein